MLLEAGADPVLGDAKGNDPLSVAVEKGLVDVEGLLRQHLASSRPESTPEASTPAEVRSSNPDTSSTSEGARISGGEKDLLTDTPGLSLWEEEAETPRPEGDATCFADARQMQEQISSHEPVNIDEDWSDVDIDLPELLEFGRRRRRTWEEDTDWQNEARQLLLAGIRNGWVREAELVRSVPPDEEDWDAPDQEHLTALRVVLGDLDVQVLDAPDALVPSSMGTEDEGDGEVNPEDPVELLADEALVFLSSFHSYTNDPLTQYVKDIGSAKSLSREEEIELACEISSGIRESLGSVPWSSAAMAELLDGLKRAERGDVPIKSIISSEDNTVEDVAGEDSGDIADDEESDSEDARNRNTVPFGNTTLASEIPADLHDKFESIRVLHMAMKRAQSIAERETLAGRLRDEIHDLGMSTDFIERLCKEVESDNLSPQARAILESGLNRARRAKNKFALANLRLVLWFARKFGGMPYIDRVQEGNIGLLKAIDRFDPYYGVKFSTYAVWWIRQSIMRAIADKGRLIRLPVHMVESRRKIQSTSSALATRLQRAPTAEELALEADIPENLVQRILCVPEDPIPLLSIGDSSQSIEESIADFVTPNPEEVALHVSLKEALDESLQCLTEKEADVIRLRFGLDNYKDHTLEQIGHLYGVTRERIRQIEVKAMRKLAHPVRTEKLKAFLE